MTEPKRVAQNPVIQRIKQHPLFLVALIGLLIAMAWQLGIGGFQGHGFDGGPERLFWISLLLANASQANQFPKMILRTGSDRAVNRLTGWAMVFGSLISALFWALAPIPVARWATMAFFGTAMIFLCGYVLLMRIESTRIADIVAVSALILAALASAAIWLSEPTHQALPLTIAIFGGTAASAYAYLRTKRARDQQRRSGEDGVDA
jgi:hypothetical protein